MRLVGRAERDADARVHEHLAAARLARVQREGRVERVDDALRRARGVAGVAHVLDQDRELVAAEARGRVAVAQAVAQAVGHRHQQLVAHRVPERVVHRLEVVEVEEHHGHARVQPLGAAQGVVHPVGEERAVGQARERVVEGLVLELVGRLALAVVGLAQLAHAQVEAAVGLLELGRALVHPLLQRAGQVLHGGEALGVLERAPRPASR